MACGLFCRYCSDLPTKEQFTPYNRFYLSIYLLYWYRSTNTDARLTPCNSIINGENYRLEVDGFLCTQFTCFTSTKVQILTPGAACFSIIKGVDYIDWGWKDFFGPCCQHSTTPDKIVLNAGRLNDRLSGLNVSISIGTTISSVRYQNV